MSRVPVASCVPYKVITIQCDSQSLVHVHRNTVDRRYCSR